jgi:transcriptional regulator with XRE-family HTH domain
MVTRGDVEQETQRLNAVVARAIDSPSQVNLAAVNGLLRKTASAVESLLASPTVDLSEERRSQYFPPAGPVLDTEQLRVADERWQEARARGRRYRAEAQAQVGPLLTPSQTAERLGVSAVTVSKWRRQGKLLGLRFDDHQYLYPLFQFADSPLDGERGTLWHLETVLAALGDRTGWEKALFLLAPLPALHGLRPIEVLRSRPTAETLARLVDLARHAGEMGQ